MVDYTNLGPWDTLNASAVSVGSATVLVNTSPGPYPSWCDFRVICSFFHWFCVGFPLIPEKL